MRITCIGGGPASLYFAILLRKRLPSAQIDIYEQNRADDTFGWGVVFSDETLGNFEVADPESYQRIRDHFAYWTDIDTFYAGEKVTSTGHGFCGLARKQLLLLLQERCHELGVGMHFEHTIEDVEKLAAESDLVVAADGVNSKIRQLYASSFQPDLDWRKCKFAWFGTTKKMTAFTFVFKETEWGLFQVHAYPFEDGLGTWIVECREETWARAGLDKLSEEESAQFCHDLFREHLEGEQLLTNRSIWRTFPTVRCGSWRHENVVLLGDAAHTAHFSIGSGTKLAMEDAIALADAVADNVGSMSRALEVYEDARRIDVLKVQRAAQTSLEWFENSGRYLQQSPERFVFNLMTRSKRITHDNLETRDPDLVRGVDEVVAAECGAAKVVPPAFLPFTSRDVTLPNRVVVSPMCMYSATDGVVDDWHFVHLGSRAVGGPGLVMTEMTNVTAEGLITPGCAGMWTDDQEAAWRRVVDFVHTHSAAKVGMQLAHAGRKASCSRPWEGDAPLTGADAWQAIGPSATPFGEGWPAPRAMERADMERVRDAFVASAQRCVRAGFDLVELHMAHGYLLSSFLSPLSNLREDEFGGTLEARARFPLEVARAVRAALPEGMPLFVRLSATDWFDEEERGFTVDEAVQTARWLKEAGVDVIDVSSAGNAPESKPQYGRMYQVPFAERIRFEADVPVMAVGGIQGLDHAHTIVAAGRADLFAAHRQFLPPPPPRARPAPPPGPVRDRARIPRRPLHGPARGGAPRRRGPRDPAAVPRREDRALSADSDMALAHRRLATPLGVMHAFASARGLRALVFDGRDPAANGVAGVVVAGAHRAVLRSCAEQLSAYFRGALRSFVLPLDPIGTEFQRQAWRALQQIPYGETRSYGQQAAAIDRPSAVRAIGAANGRNPLTIVVPCHRVIGARGALTGFASGLGNKRALLELEGAL